MWFRQRHSHLHRVGVKGLDTGCFNVGEGVVFDFSNVNEEITFSYFCYDLMWSTSKEELYYEGEILQPSIEALIL